jgi:hypothetical protein
MNIVMLNIMHRRLECLQGLSSIRSITRLCNQICFIYGTTMHPAIIIHNNGRPPVPFRSEAWTIDLQYLQTEKPSISTARTNPVSGYAGSYKARL